MGVGEGREEGRGVRGGRRGKGDGGGEGGWGRGREKWGGVVGAGRGCQGSRLWYFWYFCYLDMESCGFPFDFILGSQHELALGSLPPDPILQPQTCWKG